MGAGVSAQELFPMPSNPRAVQELDLLLDEGQAGDPLLIQGLVHLYGNELFRFAWEIAAAQAENPTVQRLLARRTVVRALTAALQHLPHFQEQPSTFLWLLRLTYQQAPQPAAEFRRLLSHLAHAFHLSLEEIAYILKIPERRATALLENDSAQPPPPGQEDGPGSAVRRDSFTPLTPAESAVLIDALRASQPGTSQPFPRFAREFALICLALVIFTAFVRAAPHRVFYLPTPVPSPTPTQAPPFRWEMTPIALATLASPLPGDVFYEPENPYLIWRLTRLLQGEPAFVRTMAASPTGPLLAVGNNRSQIALWDLTTFTRTQTLAGHTGGIQSLAFSSDGALLASGGGDGVVQLWEMPAGHLVQVFDGHPNLISSLAFSPDGQTLAVAAGKELWFWQVNEGAKIAAYKPFDHMLTSLSYSVDGNFLTVSEVDGTGWVLRARDAFPLLSIEVQNFGPLAEQRMRFSPDGKSLVAMSSDAQPVILRLQGNTDHLEAEVIKSFFNTDANGTSAPLLDFAFSPDGKIAAATREGGAVHLWDTHTWTPLQASLQRPDYQSSSLQLAISFDNTLLAVSHHDGEIAIWQLVDVSQEVGVLQTPRFYERLDSDVYRWSTVIPKDLPTYGGDTGLSELERISAAAGFTVKIPLVKVLGGDYTFNSFYYDPVSGIAFTHAWSENNPGTLWGFALQQRKVRPGEGLLPNEIPFPGIDKIGITAVVEPIQMGALYGEWVLGQWVYLEEENVETWNDSTQPGDEIHGVSRWSADLGNLSLRWMDGDILYEIKAYADYYLADPVAIRDALVHLAQSMYAPEKTPIPWNVTPYHYTVALGDGCSDLADRFYTTVETIRNLNHLGADCALSTGQTLLLPYPAEPLLTTDLNCDNQEETVLLIHDVIDPALLVGVAIDIVSPANIHHRLWEFSAADMGLASLRPLELISLGGCEQLIVLTGGTPTDSRTRVFRWDGTTAWILLNASGRPYSTGGTVAALPQNPDEAFVIPLIQYMPSPYSAAGPCPNEVTDYTWDGSRFQAGEMQIVWGECAGN